MIFKLVFPTIAFINMIVLHAEQIYRYDVPIVTVRAGNAWTINGNFKLVHIINLDEFATIADNVTALLQKYMPPSKTREVINYHLTQVQDRLMELGSIQKRNRRSIDWIGSAWKWVAGNPDAADWNSILKSQNAIISNNNEQYKINAQFLNITNKIVQRTNELIDRMNEISNGKESQRIEQDTMNQVLILKDTVNEVVRACQLAKGGIINTNLLDRTEVEKIITELETLPYTNAVEAIEYGKPSIYTNGSLLIYVLSLPKLKKGSYHRLIARTTIREGRQIELPFKEILISQEETFGVASPCLNINKATICQQSSLIQIDEETCIPRMLKGGNANCRYKITSAQVVEMITSDVIFLTNFKGVIKTQKHTETLNGTYLIQLHNESLLINNETFSSTSVSRLQPLPPVLTSVANEKLLVDIDQVHNISLHNVDKLQYLGTKLNLSLGSNIGIVIIMGICIGSLWHRITGKMSLPTIKVPQSVESTFQPKHVVCGTQTFKEGGVNSGTDTANERSSAESA